MRLQVKHVVEGALELWLSFLPLSAQVASHQVHEPGNGD